MTEKEIRLQIEKDKALVLIVLGSLLVLEGILMITAYFSVF